MSKATVAADLHQATDISVDFAAEVSLYLEVTVQNFTKMGDFGLGKIFDLLSRIDPRFLHKFVDVVLADAIQHRQCVEHRFVAREVDTCNSCHALNLFLVLS